MRSVIESHAVFDPARSLKVGLYLPVGGEGMMGGDNARWSDLRAMARAAEDTGFDFVSVLDHFDGHWEGWSLLSALAASTSRIELVSYVSCTSYRNPALLAKMADTVDEISGGRLILGLGAGDSDSEHRAYGFPRDKPVSRFEEALTIVAQLLREGHCDFRGDYYTIQDVALQPRGPRLAGPPILVGSLGGQRLLRLTVQHADIWTGAMLINENRVEGLDPMLETVAAACRRFGRDPESLTLMMDALVEFPGGRSASWTDMMPISGTVTEMARTLLEFPRRGISMLQVWIEPNTVYGIESFAPVLAMLREEASAIAQ